MKTSYLAAMSLACAMTLPIEAHAASFTFNFGGPVVSGSLDFTYDETGAGHSTGTLGTSPNTVDPVGSYVITDVTGTFSDARLGLSNVAVTGVVAANPGSPTSGNKLAPASFGFYHIDSGVSTPEGPADGFSYDSLFYPHGSPQTATDYPGAGGFLDIYGVVFKLADGKAVDLWSNGSLFGSPVTYGLGVTDGKTVLDYVSSVPEPATWAMMIGGFGMIGGVMRRRRTTVTYA
jgi:hypothetical protein